MKNHIFIILMILIICMVISGGVLAESVSEDELILFSATDPIGDELGAGTYIYPLHKQFEPYQGLFDLTQFVIVDADPETYRLELTFVELRDPWLSKFGYSHPLIQIYIDNESGGDIELFRPGANVKLDPAAPWDVMLHITGWWVRAFRPSDREKLSVTDIYWNDAKNPFDLEAVVVKREENVIRIELPKEVVGNLMPSRMFVMVGSFYAFGFDHYREIEQKSSDWAFGGSNNLKLSPRVLDLLVPEGMEQSEILQINEDTEELVTIPYISIGKSAGATFDEKILIWLSAVVVAFLLVFVIIKKSKNKPISN